MKFIKFFEEYEYHVGSNAERQREKALQDMIFRLGDDKKKIEYDKIEKEISDPKSEEGENWSDYERNRLNKWVDTFAKDYDVPSTKEAKIIQLSNDLINSINHFDACMKAWTDSFNDEFYEPMGDWNKVPKEMIQKATILTKELKDIDKKLDFWRDKAFVDFDPEDYPEDFDYPTLSNFFEKQPGLIPEAEKMVDLIEKKLKEGEVLFSRKGLDFTYHRHS